MVVTSGFEAAGWVCECDAEKKTEQVIWSFASRFHGFGRCGGWELAARAMDHECAEERKRTAPVYVGVFALGFGPSAAFTVLSTAAMESSDPLRLWWQNRLRTGAVERVGGGLTSESGERG